MSLKKQFYVSYKSYKPAASIWFDIFEVVDSGEKNGFSRQIS